MTDLLQIMGHCVLTPVLCPVLTVDTFQPQEAGELYDDLDDDSSQAHKHSEYQ